MIAKPAQDMERERRYTQSAIETVQDILDGWPGDADRPDVYDALTRARSALWEAAKLLETTPAMAFSLDAGAAPLLLTDGAQWSGRIKLAEDT